MSFDLLAPHYRWMEFVLAGEKLQRCRTTFLDDVPPAHRILLLGEGHGRCLVECCRRFPRAEITCVDASEKMLKEARRRAAANGADLSRVRFVHADVLHWIADGGNFDLIVTNFFLDCFGEEQLERVVSRLSEAASHEANWLIADFQMASAGWKRARTRLILWSMYVFFRSVTRLPARRLTIPDELLNRHGFALHRRVESEWGLLHSDWWTRNGRTNG